MTRTTLWRIWGEWFNYPQCCIDEFCDQTKRCNVSSDHPAHATGFVPCAKCRIETQSMSKKLFEEWLGRSIHMYSTHDTLSIVQSDEWRSLAKQYDYDVDSYISWLR